MGKPRGESRGLAYLQKARPEAMSHLLRFFAESGKRLEPKTRSLISVVTKVINFSPRGLQQYVKRALEAGATPGEVVDAVLCSYPCAGLTRVVDAIDVILDMGLDGFEEAAQEGPSAAAPATTSGAATPESAAMPAVAASVGSDLAAPAGWTRVAGPGELSPGETLEVQLGTRSVAVFHTGEKVFAIDNFCPHKHGPLGHGPVQGGVVTCPLHGWRFQLETGISVSHPGHRVATWPVRVLADGAIEVQVPRR